MDVDGKPSVQPAKAAPCNNDCKAPDNSPVAAPEYHPSALATKLGTWAYNRRDMFQSEGGSLAFRNFSRSLAAIVPYVFASVGVQHFFHHTVNSGKNTLGPLTPVFKPAIMQNTAAIALSFTVFRSFCKVWSSNYDRIFAARSPDEAIRAVDSLAENVVRDTGMIVPNEFGATALSAITLGAIRTGLKTPEPPGSQKNNWAQFKGNYSNDWLANALGYTVFFEASDRLYSVFSKYHQNGVYVNGKLAENGNGNGQPQPYDIFTKDTPIRVAFRNGASVFLAALPFIATQRYANYKTGNYQPAKHSYMQDVKVGLASWEPSFAIFTSGMELYQRRYDELFKKLQDKYTARQL